jgi:RNA polymerase sigma factor (sigma-70 family)
MQDTYLSAYEKLHQFKKEALFSTWLIRIGINVALGKLRKGKRFAPAATLEDILDNSLILQLPEPSRMNPEKIAIQKEVKQLLEKAIDCLPEKYRIIYVLREMEDMRINEIMQCLDLSESNVKVRLHRAKAMLKESLYQLSISRDVFEFGFKRCDAIVKRVMTALG